MLVSTLRFASRRVAQRLTVRSVLPVFVQSRGYAKKTSRFNSTHKHKQHSPKHFQYICSIASIALLVTTYTVEAVVNEKQKKQEFVRMLDEEVTVLRTSLDEADTSSVSTEVTDRFLKETGFVVCGRLPPITSFHVHLL